MTERKAKILLIVPVGIEKLKMFKNTGIFSLLIVPVGIEITLCNGFIYDEELLIVPVGIEIWIVFLLDYPDRFF